MKPVCLTIAGSDSGGGAGIQADIKAMQANGVFAASVVTAVTAQNTVEVSAAMDIPLEMIEAQFDAVCSDLSFASVKTGMLSSDAIIRLVARKAQQYQLAPLVVDPVMISKSGFSLLAHDAIEAMKQDLFPLAYLVTPNAEEAAELTGIKVVSLDDARQAARILHEMGPDHVLVKGGHIDSGNEAIDLLYDGESFTTFSAPRIITVNTHGTGCTYSSAIAANLALGYHLKEAITLSKEYVTEAIRHGLKIGAGHGPTDHFYFLQRNR